ncbi:ShlB/FhaC/HecB family hemolysin secretion/activation protein [Aquitalea sp. ASV15]|uniref:ShlB/FhaC/HecB family hemolysin secretion/activation protein n=1 Tax=Aquitalea sp. ASV15 TaxID=2795104 RepID=UPI001E34D941|nr:ShlB/FhaC/HecB family hemolysin secretion/activation protein [Aquitalea sp. ASV15]
MTRAWASSPLDTASLPSAVDGKASVEQHAAATLPSHEEPCFLISHIKLVGEQSAHFQWLLDAAALPDSASGRCLGSQGISLLQRRMQNALLTAGFVTSRVLVSPQNLSGGQLQFTLLPGFIHQIKPTADSTPGLRLWNALPSRPGDVLNLRDIEQGLENLQRLPSVQADFQIAPTSTADAPPNSSDVLLKWQQHRPYRLLLQLDDGGNQATGVLQGSATLAVDHLLTLNDLLNLSRSQALGGGQGGERGSENNTVGYSLPLGYWLLGLTLNDGRYRQSVAGAYENYLYHGKNENAALTLSRLLLRNADSKTGFSLQLWQRKASSFINDAEIDVQRRRMAGWELGVSHETRLGEGALSASLNYRRGTGARRAQAAPEEAFNEGSARLQLWRAEAQLVLPLRALGQAWQFSSVWRGQYNQTPLIPLDRFAIGSRSTVRGFNGDNQLSADRGWLVRNELGWQHQGREIYLAYDHGEVGGQSAVMLPGRRLAGATLGSRGQLFGFDYEVFISKPMQYPTHFRTPSSTGGFSLAYRF